MTYSYDALYTCKCIFTLHYITEVTYGTAQAYQYLIYQILLVATNCQKWAYKWVYDGMQSIDGNADAAVEATV